MKPLRWTVHALQALVDRNIELMEVERTISHPELTVADPAGREVLMRRYFDSRLERIMLP